jgi:vitamin B12 transporter
MRGRSSSRATPLSVHRHSFRSARVRAERHIQNAQPESIMRIRLLSLALVGALAISPAAAAQQRDTAALAPIVVTATRVPIASAASPATVSVVSGDELRLRGVTSVADAIRAMAGATFAQSGSFGGVTSLFLRGGESKYVKVLVDGVSVNDPGGAFDFGTLTVDNVDRIEVVRGPASVLYGADAVTGVVQIFTRRGRGDLRAVVSARGGTYGSSDADATVTAGLANGDFSLGLARHSTRGIYDFNSAYHNNVLSGGLRLRLDERTDARVTLRYTDYVFHYPTNGGGDQVDSNAMRAEDRTALALEIGRSFSPRFDARLTLNSSGSAGGTDNRQDTPASSGLQSADRTRRRSADLRTNILIATATTLSAGVQLEEQDQRSETQSVFGQFASTSVFTAARRNQAAYVQLLAIPVPSVTLTLGERLDDNERFGRFSTHRAGASWEARRGTRVRASVGTAFREPSFFENYATGYVTGNPDLAPERAGTWEIGVRQQLAGDRLTLGITHFSQRFRNLIDYTGSTKVCGASYCNVARASADGRELEARVAIVPALTLDANLTHLETRVLQPGFDTTTAGLYRAGEQLIRRPTTSWNLGAAWVGRRAAADVRLNHVGNRTDRDFRPYPALPVIVDAYTRTDVGGEVTVASRSENVSAAVLTARIENLFDVRYESVFNFRTPGRTILLGVRLSF